MVCSVDKEVGIGGVVKDPRDELIEPLSGPSNVPLFVVVIELSVDCQPPVLDDEDSVATALASDDEAGSVTVMRWDIVDVKNVVVVEVVGGLLLV